MQSFVPEDYQEEGVLRLLSQGSVGLFMNPGRGKTVTVLSAFKILKEKGYVDNMLVVAPLFPVYSVWPQEIDKWAHTEQLTYTILHGDRKDEAALLDVDIFIINPEGLKWLTGSPFAAILRERTVLCIDESTMFKNYSSKRFKLLRQYLHHFARKWIMTGTPVPRTIENLFSQIYILDEGASLGRYITHFRREFMTPHENPYAKFVTWTPKENAVEEIAERIAPLCLIVNDKTHKPTEQAKRDVFIVVELPPHARTIYDEIEREFVAEVGDDVVIASNVAVAGGKCRQVANGAIYTDDKRNWQFIHDIKMMALENLVEELDGNPLLVTYEYDHDLQRILDRFSDVPVVRDSSPLERRGIVEQFNAGEIPVLPVHPASAGHGLNLQVVCHNICHFGVTWDYELYDQVTRRVWRKGQKKLVFNHHIVAKNTKDEDVMNSLREKETTQEKIMGAVLRHGR